MVNNWGAFGPSSEDLAGYYFSLNNGLVEFTMEDQSGHLFQKTSASPFLVGEWNYVGAAVDRQSGSVDFFFNGTGSSTGIDPMMGTLSHNQSVELGRGFQGAIDEVEIYSDYVPGELDQVFQRGKCKFQRQSAQPIVSKLRFEPNTDAATQPGYALWLKQGKLALALAHAGDPDPSGGYRLHVFEGGPRLDDNAWHFVAASYERDSPRRASRI